MLFARLKAKARQHTSQKIWSHLQHARGQFRAATRVAIRFLSGVTCGGADAVFDRVFLLRLKISRRSQIAHYFAMVRLRKLQLGAGSNRLPGWLNSEGFAPSSFNHSPNAIDGY